MPNEYRFLLTSQDGIVLETAHTYVDRDIVVEPSLEEVTISSTRDTQVISPSPNHVGFSKITLNPISPYDGSVTITGKSVIGVTGLTNLNSVLTLTDNAAGLSSYTTSTNGDYTSVTNPLSDFFPYNQIHEVEDSYGNKFIEFPKFWMCWSEHDDQGHPLGYKIADYQVDSNWFVPDAFLDIRDLTGQTYVDKCWIAKYQGCAGSTLTSECLGSKTNQTIVTNITRSQARELCRAYGDAANYYNGYQQLDFATWTMYNLLCMMFYQTTNIQKVHPGRTGWEGQDWNEAAPSGTTDGVVGLDGWNETTKVVKMLGVESPYDNLMMWLDGFNALYGDGVGAIYIQRFAHQYSDAIENSVELGFYPPHDALIRTTALKHGTSVATQSYMLTSDGEEWESGKYSEYIGDVFFLPYSTKVEQEDRIVYFPAVGGSCWYDASDAPLCGLWCADVEAFASYAGSGVGARVVRKILN